MRTVFHGSLETAALLLERGAKANARNKEGKTALFFAHIDPAKMEALVRLLKYHGGRY